MLRLTDRPLSLSLMFGILSLLPFHPEGAAAQTYSLVDSSFSTWFASNGAIRGAHGTLYQEGFTSNAKWYAVDPEGTPNWAKSVLTTQVAAFPPTSMAGLNDGGFIRAFWRESLVYDEDSSDLFDTCVMRIHVARYDASGSALYTKCFQRASIDYVNNPSIDPLSVQIAPYGNSGGMYLTLLYQRSPREHISVLKLDPNGELLWARAIGDTSNVYTDPVIDNSSDLPKCTTEVDDNEYLTIQYDDDSGIHGTHLIRLDANGGLVHAHHYDYDPSATYFGRFTHATRPNGNSVIACELTISNLDDYIVLMETDGQGQLVHAELNANPWYFQYLYMGLMNDGSVIVTKEFPGNANFPNMDNSVLHSTLSGLTSMMWSEREVANAGYNYWNSLRIMALRNDTIQFFGNWTRQDQQFGTLDYGASISRAAALDLPSCQWTDTTVARIDMPLNLISITDLQPSFVSLNIDQEWSGMNDTVPITYTPLPLPSLVDRCSNFVGIAGSRSRPPSLEVFPSPVSPDGTLQVQNAQGKSARIVDGRGRVVRTYPMNKVNDPLRLPMRGLDPGLYVIEVLDQRGLRVGSARFAVE